MGFWRSGQALVLASFVLGVAACSSSPPGAAPAPSTTDAPATTPQTPTPHATTSQATTPPAVVHWTACKGAAGPSGYQCTTIQVPRDPQHPGAGPTIGLALDRRPASGQKIGSLLVNPGGPGASGVDFLPSAVSFMPKSLLDRFDVVGFDPPGVSRSAPVVCLDGPGLDQYFHLDPAPPTAAGLDAVIAEDRVFAAGCERNSGAELPYVSTVDAAMDMDLVRQAVGDAQLNYLGFSYGTFLGATYAGLFPGRVRAMVLDGAIDPSQSVVSSLDEQSAAFDGDLRAALAACAASSTCPWKAGSDPVGTFLQLVDQVRSHPLPAAGTSRTVGPAELLFGTAVTLYSTASWSDLYQALAQVRAGNGTDMLTLFDDYTGRSRTGTFTNEFEANPAVNCLDAPAPPIPTLEADAAAARSAAPVFGVADLYSELGCAVWPVAATSAPAPIHAAGSPAIVVVGSTGDPATPYQDADSLAAELQHGVLLTRVGEGHTAYPYSSCIRNYVDDYLVQLAVPPAGVRCPSS